MNEQDWKDKTCEKCKYRQMIVCLSHPDADDTNYPIVFNHKTDKFKPACAEYKENV